MTERKLIGPAHAHLDGPCTEACYEKQRPTRAMTGDPREDTRRLLGGPTFRDFATEMRVMLRDVLLAFGQWMAEQPEEAIAGSPEEVIDRFLKENGLAEQ
jgi:hypothetical protein